MHCLLNEEIENKIQVLRQREFAGANKPGWFLAWQIKKKREKKIITEIKVHGKVISDQNRIKKAFRDFYVDLYHSNGGNEEKIKQYLQKVKVEKMSEKFNTLMKKSLRKKSVKPSLLQNQERHQAQMGLYQDSLRCSEIIWFLF